MMKIQIKKLSEIVIGFLVLTILVLGNIAIVNASDTGSGKAYVPKGGFFYAVKNDIKRTLAYNNVYVTVESVYPEAGKDNFTKCRCKLVSGSTDISDVKTITEGTGKQSIKVKNGYLNKKKFTLKFAGNNPDYGAYIIYKYDGR